MFISHTSELRDFPRGTSYVAAAERAISAAGHVIVDMAGFPAADQPSAQVCAEQVQGCDVYVGILGTRYGSPVRDQPEVSYTELEFAIATEAGLARLVFLLDTDAADAGIPLPVLIDREFGARQDAFRRRVQDSELTTQSFENPAGLGQLVERSLRALADMRPRIGSGIEREQVRGWPLGEVTDPFALEVHRPIQPDDPQPGLPALPAYVPREHDAELASVVRAAAEGSSEIAVLVGGSSTGKTRACWEALRLLRDRPGPWRLWHPIDPTRAEAALRELPGIGPRTVVWLNEAQFYLDAADGGLGERVAAGLRELLRAPARAPVLVLATLWPQYWHSLTARPAGDADPHAQARELLAGHDITVPAAFTAAQLQRLSQAGDARLVQAAAGAQDGQVIQFLAGAPELLARYRNADPPAKALIHAAMDARRLGMGVGLPQAFLEAAAPGYMTDTEWDALGEDWLEQALDYTAVPSKGVRGPLTRIRPRPARSRGPGPGSPDGDEQQAGGEAGIPGVPLYRLADYLDQHGRYHREGQFPPTAFWAAAAGHAFPGDQAALGDAAHDRGLYRAAAQLRKNAAARGDLDAVVYLANPPRYLRNDVRPVRWAAAHVPLDDPGTVANLLYRLRDEGAEQVTALLARDPAARVSLDDPYDVARLLDSLRVAGAKEQVTALLARDPAARVSLENPEAVATLLSWLREAGAQDQVTALAERAAARAPLDHPRAVGALLRWLREAGAQDQVTALAERAAARVSLDDPGAVAWLLDSLRKAGAQEQVTALAERAAARVSLDDPGAVARLLDRLQEAGAQDQVTALAERAAARVSLDDPGAVAWLLDSLRKAGAQEQVTALAERAAARVPLDDPGAVAWLLDVLLEAGAKEQVTALLARDPAARATPDDPDDVIWLLDRLRKAGAKEQVTALAERAAARVPLDDPGAVAWLLDVLLEAGAKEQVTALLARDPAARATPDDPDDVIWLLDRLRKAGAKDQVTALAERVAARVSLDDPGAVASLLDRLRKQGAKEQVTALLARDPPGASPSTIRAPWPGCWIGCGSRAPRSRSPRCWPGTPPGAPPSTIRAPWPACWTACGRRARRSRPPRCWPGTPPPAPPSTTRAPWPACWTACGRRARRSRPPRCWPGTPPPAPPSTTRAPRPACWTACGRRARRSRPPH